MKFNRGEHGDIKIKRKFLFFPKTLKCWMNGNYRKQTRWLEFAYIEYEYKYWSGWNATIFTTKEEYNEWKKRYL